MLDNKGDSFIVGLTLFKAAGIYNRGGFDVVLVYREEPSEGSEGKGD